MTDIPEPDDPRWGLSGPPQPKPEPPTWFKVATLVVLVSILGAIVVPLFLWTAMSLWGLVL